MKISLVFILILTSPVNISTLSFIRSDSNLSYFFDDVGRVRMFHGTNRIQKKYNYFFPDMLKDNEAKYLNQLGFNIVRLGWMWDGFEPTQNNYNDAYLNAIEKIVDNLENNGIYTLLDLHQDVLNSKFCTYNGIPNWVMIKSKSKMKFPSPLIGNCSSRNWEENYLTEAVAQGFQDLYDNTNGMLDDLANFWIESSKRWKNKSNIIGYELINEPFIGNFYKNPFLFLPGIAGKINLMPFYDKLNNKIRQTDDKHIIFYEPITWGMLFTGNLFGNGLNHVPGGNLYKNRSAYSYHYYCNSFIPNSGNKSNIEICDHILAKKMFISVENHNKKIGGTSIMTEFGACTNNNLEQCDELMNLADENFQSWIDFSYAENEIFEPNDEWIKIYSRTYPRTISGLPINMTYNSSNEDFSFFYFINDKIEEPTEIYFKNTTGKKKIIISENLQYKINGNLLNLYSINTEIHDSKKNFKNLKMREKNIGCVYLIDI